MEEADTVCQPALPRRRLCSVSFLPGRAPRARLVRRPETVNVDEARVETGASSESRLPPANANQAGASCARMSDAVGHCGTCLLYTSDAADDLLCVDLGG